MNVRKSLLYRLFERLARALGILDIQSRLDHLDLLHSEIQGRQNDFQLSQEKFFQALLEQSENAKKIIPIIQSVERLIETRSRNLYMDFTLEQENLRQRLEQHLRDDINRVSQILDDNKVLIDSRHVQIRRDIDGLRASIKSIPSRQQPFNHNSQPTSSAIDDALYVSLEDRFRGDASVVSSRQKDYLPYVKGIASSSSPVLDLGCGRGEWLELLKLEGIPARGIDSNESAVSECISNGLEVTRSEILATLTATPTNSIGVVTMFQVLEHLSFDEVIRVLREALRVLIPGGTFIGEIPNCETLRVGASTFWIDPTHQRPLFPAVLEFLATQVGFRSVEGRYSSPLSPMLDLSDVPDQIASVLNDLHFKVNGPGDFAVIAMA